MKIDGPSDSGLLQRMQQTHQEATKAEGAAAGKESVTGFSVREAESSLGSEPAGPSDKSPLAARVEVTAAKALRGEFEDDRQVREAVIDAVIDERLSNTLSAAEKRSMSATLKEALVDDPAFIRKVDDMLLFAAREHRETP